MKAFEGKKGTFAETHVCVELNMSHLYTIVTKKNVLEELVTFDTKEM
jgi:hypothetical protein